MKTKTTLKSLPWLAALGLFLVTGAARADLVCDDPDDGMEPPLPTDVCIEPEDASTPNRWLGLANGTVCPPADPERWETTPLFEPAGGGNIPPGLKRYCLYSWQLSGMAPTAPDARLCPVPDGACLEQLDPDSLSLAYQGGSNQTIEGLVWQSLRDHFVEQTGATGSLPGTDDLIRLAVIDTEPTGPEEWSNGPGTSPHGFTLLNMAREMVCPDLATAACGIDIQSRLGLPLRFCSNEMGSPCPCNGNPNRVCEDPVNGGYVGTIGQLAVAIRDEVRAWTMSTSQRIVINLSLGWDPLFGGVPGGPVSVQAVHSALQDARCRGAIIVAAAGNRISGPGVDSGPLYPGGWEEIRAPGPSTCSNLLENANPPNGNDFPQNSSVYFPLVYSAASVRNNNDPIAQRPGGEPPLVAFGDHAVATVTPVIDPKPTATFTGSSVASVVVSSAAAAAWLQRPMAAGYEIMNALYDGAHNAGRTADFCEGGAPCSANVKRATVCSAVVEACAKLPGGACPITSCETPDPVLPSIAIDAIDADYTATMVTDVSIADLTEIEEIADCRPGYKLHWTEGTPIPTNPCPQRQFYALQATPWTDGQPSGQPCETCTSQFKSPGKLYLEVNNEFTGSLTDITLLCGDNAYRLEQTLTPGEKLKMSEIPEACEFEELAVSYRVIDSGGSPASVVSPVLDVLDRDDDGIQDGDDNCIQVPNIDQRDTNGDGIGNVCDADLTGPECTVNFADLAAFKQAFLTQPGDADWTEDADFDGDGFINFGDLVLVKQTFLSAPGPSALGCN